MHAEPMILGSLIGLVIVMLLGLLLFHRMRVDWFGSHIRDLPFSRLKYLAAARFFRMV